MTRLAKISLMALVTLVLFAGCDNQSQQGTKRTLVDINKGVNIYCDKEKGVEYLIFKGYKSGGMTIRTNNDGSVSLCK